MEFTIYDNGMPVDHVTARTLESAQEHADASHNRPVVAVLSDGNAGTIAAAKYQSRLLAAKVTERIDMLAEQYANVICGEYGISFASLDARPSKWETSHGKITSDGKLTILPEDCEPGTRVTIGFSNGQPSMHERVKAEICAALHLFRQSSNLGMAAALREIAGLEGPAKVIAERALEVGGVR